MATAMGSVEILANHLDRLKPGKRKALFDRINTSLNRMTTMLDDVLLLNRIDAKRVEVQPMSFNPRLLINDVIDGIRMGDSDHHRFEFSDQSKVETFISDTQILQHILDNLLTNAARYSPAGSVITVQLRADARKLQLIVTDQGIGIPPDDRDRIFEPFERGSNIGDIKGHGLGLNIVKRMTDRLGGTIAVECPKSGGSSFTLSIPQMAAF